MALQNQQISPQMTFSFGLFEGRGLCLLLFDVDGDASGRPLLELTAVLLHKFGIK
jgi:hypothetical protein